MVVGFGYSEIVGDGGEKKGDLVEFGGSETEAFL